MYYSDKEIIYQMHDVRMEKRFNILLQISSNLINFLLISFLFILSTYIYSISSSIIHIMADIASVILFIYIGAIILQNYQHFDKDTNLILNIGIIFMVMINILSVYLHYQNLAADEKPLIQHIVFTSSIIMDMTAFLSLAIVERKKLKSALADNIGMLLSIIMISNIYFMKINLPATVTAIKFIHILILVLSGRMISKFNTKNSYRQINEQLKASNKKIEELEQYITNLRESNIKQQMDKEKIARLSRLYSFLRNINQVIVFSEEPMDLYEQTCRIAVEVGLFDMAWIGIFDPDKRQISPAAYHRNDNMMYDLLFDMPIHSHCCMIVDIIKKDACYVINDIETSELICPMHMELKKYARGSLAVFPIKREGIIIGFMSFLANEKQFFKQNEIHLLTCLMDDISFALESMEHKKQFLSVHNALLESEERFRSSFELAGIGMGLITPDGRWIKVNHALCELVGYTEDELLTMTYRSLIYPDDAEFDIDYKISLLDGKKQSYQIEKRFVHKRGHIVWVIMNLSIVHDTKQNKPLHYIIQLQDITRRKLTEEALQQSRQQYKTLVDLLPDAVLVHDKGKCVFVNNAFINMLKYNSEDEIIGKDISSFIYLEDAHELDTIKNNFLSFKSLFECKMLCTDNDIVDVEIISTSVNYSNKKMILSVIRNIWERKKVDELNRKSEEDRKLLQETLELDRIRNDFFANVSHELKTPINVILSTVQLLNLYVKKCDSEIQEKICSQTLHMDKYLGIIKQNGNRLIRLVNNLVDSTKIEAGFLTPHLKNQNIVAIIRDISLSVAHYIENKGFTLIFYANVDEIITACDKDKIERIILNLLSNAVKFTDPGGKITVSVIAEAEKVIISVKDTGIGIPENKLEVIFERFHQVDKSLSRNYEGSGIGLSLVKSLVEMHNGTIRAVSEQNNGSEFIIELPVQLVPEEEDTEYVFLPDSGQRVLDKIDIEFSDIYH